MTEANRGLFASLVAVLILASCAAGPRQVTRSGKGAYEASLQTTASGFIVAWHDYRDGNAEIYTRVLDVEGRSASPEIRLTRSPALSLEADVDTVGDNNDTEIVVAWYERPRSGSQEAWVGRWTPTGETRWERRLSAPERHGRNPVVRVSGESMLCAWLEDDNGATEVWAQWFDVSGEPLGKRARLGWASATTWNLNAAVRIDGRAWVVFDAVAGTKAAELFLAEVAPAGSHDAAEVIRLTDDDGHASKYPDIDIDPGTGRVALTWFDERDGNREVYLAVVSEKALRLGQAEAHQLRVTNTPGESIGAYLAWNRDRIGLSWSDEIGGQHEVFFAPFDADGHPLRPTQRLTANSTASLIPAISPWAEGFALVWNEDVLRDRGTHETGGNSEVVFSLVR